MLMGCGPFSPDALWRRLRRPSGILAVACIAPAVLLLLFILAYPVLQSLGYAFFSRDLLRAEQGMQFNLTLADYVDLQERSRTLESVAAYTYVSANLTGGDLPERVQAYRVTANTFSLLGVPAALGRSFQPADGDQGRDDVVATSAMAGGSDGSVAPQRSSGDAWTSTASRTKSSASCREHSKSRLQLQR